MTTEPPDPSAHDSASRSSDFDTVSAVVVSYNSAQRVSTLLPLLVAGAVRRIVVVDNASRPADRAALGVAASAYPSVSIVDAGANLGFGAAAHCGVDALAPTDDELLWILNPDLEPTTTAAAQLADHLRNDRADIITPFLVSGPAGRPVVYFASGRFDWARGTTLHERGGQDAACVGTGLVPTGFITGAALMMRASTWRELGGFRRDYFLYWEDADLSMRAQRLGLRLAVDLDARVWHDASGSSFSEGRSIVYYWYMARNRRRFLREWQPGSPRLSDRFWRAHEFAFLASLAARESEQRWAKLIAVIEGYFGWGDPAHDRATTELPST